MSKDKKPKPIRSIGPYLAVAVLCEKVLMEKDGTNSLIRIFDKLTMRIRPLVDIGAPPLPPEVQVTAFVSFRSGDFKGEKKLSLTCYRPDGTLIGSTAGGKDEITLTFLGEQQGLNAIVDLQLPMGQSGVHSIEVYLSGKLQTKIPLIVDYEVLPAKSAENANQLSEKSTGRSPTDA